MIVTYGKVHTVHYSGCQLVLDQSVPEDLTSAVGGGNAVRSACQKNKNKQLYNHLKHPFTKTKLRKKLQPNEVARKCFSLLQGSNIAPSIDLTNKQWP